MHEQSLVKNLLKQVEAIRLENQAQHVTEVCVEVGPLSGIEPLLLASAFEQLAYDDTIRNASLRIDQVHLLAKCDECRQQTEIKGFDFRCPTCGSNLRVTQGDELHLVSVSLARGKPQFEGSIK